MGKTKLTHNLIIIIPILLALVVVCGIIYINWNKSNEGFNTNTEPKKQIDNLIATGYNTKNIPISTDIDKLQQFGFDNPNTEDINEAAVSERRNNKSTEDINEKAVSERRNNKSTEIDESAISLPVISFTPTNKSSIILDDIYVIKQLHLTGITGDFRIGIKNSARNKISYVSSLELHHDAISKVFADNSPKFVMMTINKSADNNVFDKIEPTDIYGNELVGDEIIVYSQSPLNGDEAYVMGHLENEHFHEDHETQELERKENGNVGYDLLTTDKTELEKSSTNQVPYGITKMEIPISIETKIKVLFQNNYSNNSFTFEGPLPNREFIVTPIYHTIYFHHTLLANKVVVLDVISGNVIYNNIKLYGYTPSINDINRFKLEYNLTDVRGSINPDDVCPSLDQYMNDQLSSEIVIDAMEYHDKINMEKMKLANNKASMLTLLEQEEEIEKLDRMVQKINNIHQQRKHSTNAMNALQLRRQMDEVLKLRQVLDDRIKLRQQNSMDIPVDINLVEVDKDNDNKDSNKDDTNLDVFADIPLSKEEDMKLA